MRGLIMMQSMTKNVATPVFLRPPRRTWLNASGQVVTPQKSVPKAPPPAKMVEWEACVVDTATDKEIPDYPTLKGETTVSNTDDPDRELTAAYINKCRYLDNSAKVDMALLEKNIAAGIWEVYIKTPEPA
jgi:hypothetical protein